MIRDRQILLTGGCGFIGSHLVRRLAPANRVIAVDNLRRDALQYFNIPDGADVRIEQRDILEPGALDDLLEGVDLVIHLAAVAGVSNYIRFPADTMVNNLVGTHRVLEACRGRSVERFVNFSTSEVYGPIALEARESEATALGPLDESRWTYAASKVASEHLCFAFHRQYGLPVTSIRPFNIYGPGQVGEGAIHDIAMRALRDQTVQVTGDGNQVRTWCYIDDLVDATFRACVLPGAVGQVFNIGRDTPVVKIVDLARMIIDAAGSVSQIAFVPHMEADVRLRSPNVDRMREVLRFDPATGLDEGLHRTVGWYRDNLEALGGR
jgi:nucleoside-diphosphate-sugar epimerase